MAESDMAGALPGAGRRTRAHVAHLASGNLDPVSGSRPEAFEGTLGKRRSSMIRAMAAGPRPARAARRPSIVWAGTLSTRRTRDTVEERCDRPGRPPDVAGPRPTASRGATGRGMKSLAR